ncbi:MAG: hypothetical protein SFU56_11830 [Capsulimonadales bacterium]|nr:hypothetical protein [Capsulimonadales bacterium]
MHGKLERALLAESYVRLHRDGDTDSLNGFVVGLSQSWVLLNALNVDTLTFNGFEAVRLADITRMTEPKSFIPRALRWRRERPQPMPDLLLEDILGLLSSANTAFALLTLHQEKIESETYHIGRVERLGRRKVTLAEIDSRANWKRTGKYRYEDITRVTLGDGYAAALWEVGAQGWRERRAQDQQDQEEKS